MSFRKPNLPFYISNFAFVWAKMNITTSFYYRTNTTERFFASKFLSDQLSMEFKLVIRYICHLVHRQCEIKINTSNLFQSDVLIKYFINTSDWNRCIYFKIPASGRLNEECTTSKTEDIILWYPFISNIRATPKFFLRSFFEDFFCTLILSSWALQASPSSPGQPEQPESELKGTL